MRRIRVASPKRLVIFITLIAVAVLGVFGAVKLIQSLTADPIIAQIEQKEGSKITLITVSIKAYLGDEEIAVSGAKVPQGSKVVFAAAYQYKLPNGTIKTYSVSSGVTITDETDKNAQGYLTVGESFVTIGNGISSDFQVKISVKYQKQSAVYTFTVPAQGEEIE
ncbi:MAG: hypothetical protein GX061_05535 [Eubacteriaceae bacterium]|nr:hypothetical protein [Eubacteriaceae bacterium]